MAYPGMDRQKSLTPKKQSQNMDFKDSILQFAARIEKLCPQIKTEEATKNALIMPFIQILGYDVFNPSEVNPEFIADIGIKKGEKVDYAIMKDGKPIILIECKHFSEKLDPHNSQLFRYFHTTDAKFGLLTNGIHFKFYTDLNTPNKMDDKPFFEFDVTHIKDNEIHELKKFSSSYFDLDSVTSTASELKYLNELKGLIANEISQPKEEFVRYFAKQIYGSVVTQRVLEQFTNITKRAFSLIITESVSGTLKTALKAEEEKEHPLTELEVDSSNIVTTEEEIEAFMIIKAISRKYVETTRVVLRDSQTYCAILLDDNNRKPIVRLYFNGKRKFISVPQPDKTFSKDEITSLDDIYNFSESILNGIRMYTNQPA